MKVEVEGKWFPSVWVEGAKATSGGDELRRTNDVLNWGVDYTSLIVASKPNLFGCVHSVIGVKGLWQKCCPKGPPSN